MKVIEQEIAALKNTINEMWALVHQQIYLSLIHISEPTRRS